MSIYKGDTGTTFRATIKDTAGTAINISAATVKNFYFRRADGTLITRSGTFTTDGTDGKVQYTTTGADLTSAGHWKVQIEVTLSGGTWRTTSYAFEVLPTI